MYNYYQIKKIGEGFIYYRIGYSSTNNFEYYESKDNQKWSKIEVLEKDALFELRPNKDKTITFSYNKDAEDLVLDCSTDITSSLQFYNQKLEKVPYDLPAVYVSQVYQLKLVKIAFTSLPFALQQENKLSPEEPITNSQTISQGKRKTTLFSYGDNQDMPGHMGEHSNRINIQKMKHKNESSAYPLSEEEKNMNWEMSACEKICWFCIPIIGWAYLMYYYICTTCCSTAIVDEEPANRLYCI
ncbi:MAG: hypothetical protein H0T84_03940 [Tatlockia sp.]|nr:hypothetical protein [Tatlockia sp.]